VTAAALLLCCPAVEAKPHPSQAQPVSSLTLKASFAPERLGGETTVRTALAIEPPSGRPALAVTQLELFYPRGLGFASSELGLQNCRAAALEARGASACPHNSLMGHGSALVQVAFGSKVIAERAPMQIFSQPVREQHIGLLFAIAGRSPVIANLAFGGFMLGAPPPFGGVIRSTLPLVPTVPKGPDVALLGLQTSIGAQGIVYRERVKGRLVTFKPKGIPLPPTCPRGGFRFAARVRFADGTLAKARAAVRCPR
jgi:hypothetical protein